MLKKFASLVLVIALVSTLGSSSAFASSSTQPDVADVPGEIEISDQNKVQPNEKLKDNMLKLVADAKAGKVMPAAKSQIQPARSNNWSKGTKIAVGVGIAVAVVVVILVVKHERDHLFDGLGGSQ